ncbi:hypothetical protein [Massilia sp. NR 4-1]|uniref:hypothetical protein n=1 Tax=Massilia sp. NR 4-1 TaxID=1678028 RepID=UPI00067A83F2|nr:hypothetical protein [Massilia sp. NR 4-1]AKU22438.1 hypothetical protein ACZ75_14135 [Massilia sp. NR 4-1]
MQPRIISFMLCLCIFSIIAACGIARSTAQDNRPRTPMRTSASYTLTAGQTVPLAAGATLTLDRINDSRCRKGAVCVWAGYISFSFTVNKGGASQSFVLAEDMPNAGKTQVLDGLTYTLESLVPPDPPAVDAPSPDYRVTVRVTLTPP